MTYHDNPHELPTQQYSEGSTNIDHTLYLHTTDIPSKIDSFKKLEYIYHHFQDSKKTYESDPDICRQVPNTTLYPHINNHIEYGLFEDVMNSYYLDSQIKDDFNCDKECILHQTHNQTSNLHHAHMPMIILHNTSTT